MRARVVLPILLVVLVALVVFLDFQRRQARAELVNLSVRLEQVQGDAAENQERADRIVERVRSLIDIPEDVVPTVATIVDVEKLRAQNAFYNKAENGDYLVVTPTRAILFDDDRGVIVDVVPVQIEPNAAASSAASAASVE